MEKVKNDRRAFLGKAAAAGAAVAVAAGAAESQVQIPKSLDGLRVGCLNVVSYSHLALWGPFFNNRREGKKDNPLTNMRITHCWEIDPEKGRQFAKEYGCEQVKNFDDMLGKVDCIISGGYYNHPWNHIIHAPYLEAGIPNLINRPFSNSLAKAKKIIELAKKGKAPILVPSSHEWSAATATAKAWAAGKNIICYNATNSFDDYPTHGLHGVYMCCKAIAEAGFPVESVSYRADSWYHPSGVMTFEHKNKEGKSFYGTLHQVSGSWGTIQIHTPENYGGESFNIFNNFGGVGYPFDKTEIWSTVVWAFQNMATYGEMPQTYEQIYHKTNVFLAGWRSILLNDGKPVRLADVPEDWESPVKLPTQPDDNTVDLFKKKFG